jgi:hypothetical protein
MSRKTPCPHFQNVPSPWGLTLRCQQGKADIMCRVKPHGEDIQPKMNLPSAQNEAVAKYSLT